MKILTIGSNEHNDNWRKLRDEMGAHVVVVQNPWTWAKKAQAVLDFMAQCEPDELVMVLDAYDVWPINDATPEKIEKKFKAKFKSGKVLFSAEKNCYPKKALEDDYPAHDSPWKYLNAGTFIGTALAITDMVIAAIPRMTGQIDQLIYTEMFLEGGNIELDYKCDIFQTGYWLKESDLKYIKGKVTNTFTKTQPLIFHANGLSKFICD